MVKQLLLQSAILFVFAASSSADIYNCNGRWTNKPCEGQAMEVIKEDETIKGTADDPALSEKKSLFHELNMKAIQAKRRYDLRFDLSDIERLCFAEKSGLEECRAEIDGMSSAIDKKMAEQSTIDAQQRSIELQEEANRLQKERNEIEANKPTIVVEDNSYIEIVPRYRHPRRYPYVPHGGISIEQSTGTHVGHHGSAGVNVSVQETTSESVTSVGGSTGGSVFMVRDDKDKSGASVGKPKIAGTKQFK